MYVFDETCILKAKPLIHVQSGDQERFLNMGSTCRSSRQLFEDFGLVSEYQSVPC